MSQQFEARLTPETVKDLSDLHAGKDKAFAALKWTKGKSKGG